eukprot:803969-Pyramimonas_sp.AAC.1
MGGPLPPALIGPRAERGGPPQQPQTFFTRRWHSCSMAGALSHRARPTTRKVPTRKCPRITKKA